MKKTQRQKRQRAYLEKIGIVLLLICTFYANSVNPNMKGKMDFLPVILILVGYFFFTNINKSLKK